MTAPDHNQTLAELSPWPLGAATSATADGTCRLPNDPFRLPGGLHGQSPGARARRYRDLVAYLFRSAGSVQLGADRMKREDVRARA